MSETPTEEPTPAPIEWETVPFGTGSLIRAVHPPGIKHAFINGQCSCGVLDLGIVRRDG